jgi:ZIP family zinc transporter
LVELFGNINPIWQALLATLFTWGVTALGAAAVFLAKKISEKILSMMLGFAAGVMIAASFWSLLAPALEMGRELGITPWVPALVGFLLGGAFLRLIDFFLPHLHPGFQADKAEGLKTGWKQTTLLIMAITIHNFPEGLAVGVAFGAAYYGIPGATLTGALALALGIGIQNFPEGMAVSLPLRGLGLSRFKSFLYGQASALVEPMAGVLGAATVLLARPLLPYALSFASGAMIFVVVEELIPESQKGENSDIATMGALLGFAIMMLLDVALG